MLHNETNYEAPGQIFGKARLDLSAELGRQQVPRVIANLLHGHTYTQAQTHAHARAHTHTPTHTDHVDGLC